MISKKVFSADGRNTRFLSDFIIRSEQFTRVYNYLYNPAGVEGAIDPTTGLTIHITDVPASGDLVTIDSWDLVDNSISFYAAPTSGSRVYIEVATASEEFGDTLVLPSVDRAEKAALAAEAALDSFDDRYLGAKGSAPTLDNDGNALIEGTHYWNTVSKGMFTWNGLSWQVWNGGVTLDTAQTISGAKNFTVVPKANGTDLATLDTAQTISAIKDFSASPLVPNATTSGQAVNKGQLDEKAPITTTVTLDTAQTISGAKDFTTPPTIKGEVVYHEANILGTVSQTTGVPTGAIIEKGSNANGTYVKFADGTLICYVAKELLYVNTSDMSASWTFPSVFIDDLAYVGSTGTNIWTPTIRSYKMITRIYSQTTTAASVAAFNIDANNVDGDKYTVKMLAIGRWF